MQVMWLWRPSLPCVQGKTLSRAAVSVVLTHLIIKERGKVAPWNVFEPSR